MIVGIGIDSVEIRRFDSWKTWPRRKLQRLFCEHEIQYVFSNQRKKSERLASRFAVREALFKALTPMAKKRIPFLTMCSCVCLKNSPRPELTVTWSRLSEYLSIDFKNVACHVSITHTKALATAVIVFELTGNSDSNLKIV